FIYYIIDASTLILIDVSGPGVPHLAGAAYAQSGTFANATLGSSVFVVSGNRASDKQPYGQGARFDTNTAAGTFSGGIFDVNNAGTVTLGTPFTSAATYNITTTGRGTMSTGSSSFIFWLASAKQGVIMESDTVNVASGLLLQQQQSGFTSLTGGFAFVTSGFDQTGTTPFATDGQFTSSGFSVSGTLDLNSAGTTTSNSAFTGGTLSVNTNGTGSVAISPSALSARYNLYFVSPNRFLMLSTNAISPVLSGASERQCSDCTF
ncbi:MAG TPA: hypothetical protein VM912_04640, partial [Terriglobales bacterium]|nr:hypothetical protein [Terriglobales bacterium]